MGHWLSKLHQLGLNPRIEELAKADSRADLDRLEVEAIASARTRGNDLTTHTDGGHGQNGRVVSSDTRAKMSLSHKGKVFPHMLLPMSNATRIKLSAVGKSKKGAANSAFKTGVTIDTILQGLSEGKTRTQIASELNVSLGTLNSRIQQACQSGVLVPEFQRKGYLKGVNRNTPEHMVKMAAANLGSTRSAETKAKMSAAKRGRPGTRTGTKQSADARQKISASLRGKYGEDSRPFRHDILTSEILCRVAEGATQDQIAHEFNTNRGTIAKRIAAARKEGLEVFSKKKARAHLEKLVLDRLAEGVGLKQIAGEMGLTYLRVWNLSHRRVS